MFIRCYICQTRINIKNRPKVIATCMFTNRQLVRYQCPFCGVIFGPLDTIHMSQEDLGQIYQELFLQYKAPNTTKGELAITKLALTYKPDSESILSYGAGRRSTLVQELRTQGFQGFGYDPFASPRPYIYNDIQILQKHHFDIIISNNLLEHLQNPIEELNFMTSILAKDGIMAHATACYNYKYERSPVHLFFFTGKSLQVICKRLNLKIVGQDMIKKQPVKLFKQI